MHRWTAVLVALLALSVVGCETRSPDQIYIDGVQDLGLVPEFREDGYDEIRGRALVAGYASCRAYITSEDTTTALTAMAEEDAAGFDEDDLLVIFAQAERTLCPDWRQEREAAMRLGSTGATDPTPAAS